MATVSATMSETYFLQASPGDPELTYDAIDMRLILGAIFPKAGSCRTNDFWVQQKTAPGFGVTLNGGFYVTGGAGSHDRYIVYSPAQTTIELTGFVTNPAATRTHKVYLSVYDELVSGTLYTSKINIMEDVGSGAPVPTADSPTRNELLATFTISPGASYVGDAHITNVAPKASQGVGATAVPLAGGYISGEAATSGGPPRYQLGGSRVFFSGTIAKSAGTFAASTTVTIATMPTGIRPKYQRYCGALAAGGVPYRLTINTDGTVQVSELAAAVTWISIDGAFYEID